MTIATLKDLYLDQLQDLYSANRQSMDATTQLGRKATDDELSRALNDGVQGIASGMVTLKEIISEHGANPTGEFCKGMEDLVKEARAHAIDADIADKDVRDAATIPQYQRMVHYAIAGYGTAVAFANRLGLDGDAAKLQKMIDETYDGDRRMTEIASGHVNAMAAQS